MDKRPSLARLTKVELRKMVDTRSGFWLQLAVVGLAILAVVITLLAGDVRSFHLPDGEFSHVIHAATDSAIVPSATEIASTIVIGTERCLDFADRARCRKFLFTSSGAVYGTQPPEMSHMREGYGG